MPFQPAPGVLQCRLEWTYALFPQLNILYVARDPADVWSEDDLDYIYTVIEGLFWEPLAIELVTSDVRFEGVTLTSLITQNAIQKHYTTDPSQVEGHYIGSASPSNVTLAISLKTPNRWHGSSGRFYIPNIPTDQIIKDAVYTGFLDQWVAALQAIQNNLVSGVPGAYLAVLSRAHNGIRRMQAVPYPVTEILYTDNGLDSQRDRLPRHRATRRRHH